MRISKLQLEKLRKQLKGALEELNKNEDVDFSFSLGKFVYSDHSVEIKLSATVKGENGQVQSKEELDFITYADILGLKKEDLNRKVTLKGDGDYIIRGYKVNARKNDILISPVHQPDKRYVCPHKTITAALGY